ncbi:MAG TPA: MarC family protein [Gemmatimonadales bacterium]|jgi:multiple antibiotic resistance protein
MGQFLQFALVTFTSVLFIVDPLAAVPAYLVITQNETPEHRRRTALRACCSMALLLVLFAAAGGLIFRILGITLPAFRIAGGLILWLVALDMLRAQRSTQETREELAEGETKEDVALTPLAIPILAGPGAISTVMVLAGQAGTVADSAVVYCAIALTALVSYFTLRLGEQLLHFLGRTGIRVLTRIMGLLLAAVATQFILTGIREGLRG